MGDRTDSINGFLPRNSYIRDVMCQTYGDKVVSQEGNSPKQEFKVPKLLFSVKKEFTWTNLISVLAWRLPQLEEYVTIHWFLTTEKTLINLLELKQYTVSLRSIIEIKNYLFLPWYF